MPVEIVFPGPEWDVHMRLYGPIRDAEMIESLDRLFAHPDYRSDLSWLIEWEDVSLEHYGLGSVRRMAHYTTEHDADLRDAVVAVSAPQLAVFGVSRMFQLLRQPPYQLAIFRSRDAARSWLAANAPRPKRG